MEIATRIHDLFTMAKLILPYRAYKNSLVDSISENITDTEGKKALLDLGISIVNSEDAFIVGGASYIIDFSNQYSVGEEYAKDSFYYINNPDGSMRWVFPQDLKYPTFLSFYNVSSLKSKASAWLIKLAFRLGMQRFISSGSFHLYSKAKPHFKRFVYPNQVDNYSIFMGTIGPNRKVIIELNKGDVTKHFIKVALNNESSTLIKNEHYMLDKAEDFAFQYIRTPFSFLFNDDRALMQPSLYNSTSKRITDWTKLHTLAKLEMEIKTIEKSVQTYDFIAHIKEELHATIQEKNTNPSVLKLALKLEKMCAETSLQNEIVPTSFCHNDFTPWNMYVEEKSLKVYDWELAGYAPVLSDLFHFHFQKGIMLQQKSYAEISQDIFQTLEHPEWKAFIKLHSINVPFQLSMYLAKTVSYYLAVYNKQKVLHWQANALLKVWDSALDEMIAWQNPLSFRQQFVWNFFQNMQNKSYAYLKFIYGTLDMLPSGSDLDLLVAENDLEATINLIEGSVLVKKIKWVKKSFMTTAHIFLKDESFLSIDLIIAFKQTNNIMLDAKEVLKERQLVNELYVPNPKHDFEYILLFYHLNGSAIPKRYRDYFGELPEKTKRRIEFYLISKYYLGVAKLEDLFYRNEKLLSSLSDEVAGLNKNNGFYAIRNNFNYLIDTIKGIINNRGFTLTVSGVDGAGKSTIIGEIKQLLESKYRKKVVVIRHRPSVLPILSAWVHGKEKAEKLTTERLPRTGNNQSKLKSIFRFSYYLIDYLFGQFYIYFKYILRGKVVVYDRYYFDFIIDAKRSNIVINPQIPKAFYSMVQKPELNVFLYAPAAEILRRKQELNALEIEELTASYQHLFSELAQKDSKSEYLAIKNIHLKETMNAIDLEITKVA